MALATLLEETRRPDETFWDAPLVASRLTDLEVRVRSAGRLPPSRVAEDVEELLARMEWFEMAPRTLGLLYQQPAKGLRTLDLIHLSTLEFINREVATTALATYDRKLATAAESMGFTVITP